MTIHLNQVVGGSLGYGAWQSRPEEEIVNFKEALMVLVGMRIVALGVQIMVSEITTEVMGAMFQIQLWSLRRLPAYTCCEVWLSSRPTTRSCLRIRIV